MAPKKRRNRREKRDGGSSGDGGGQAGTASVAAKRERRRPAARRGRSETNWTPWLVGGGVAGALALVAIVLISVLTGAGVAANFDFDVYQGEDILGGSNVKFNDLLDDGKPVVLNFWAGNCPPCRAEMPALQKVWDRNQDDLHFVGLDVGVFTGLGTRQQALALLEELNITYPAGAPPDRTAVINYSVRSMPTTVFFDANGDVFRRWDGAIAERQMNDIIDQMLAEAAAAPPTSP